MKSSRRHILDAANKRIKRAKERERRPEREPRTKPGPKPKLKHNGHGLALLLPEPGDPLVAEDGTVLQAEALIEEYDPLKPSPINGPPPALFRAQARRVALDMPADKKVMNAICVVFGYTMAGISDTEIMDIHELTPEQLDKIREHKAYEELFQWTLGEFVNMNSEIMRSRVAGYAHKAVTKVGFLAQFAKRQETQLSAAKDILNRANVGPEEQNGADAMNEFRITIIAPDKDVQVEIEPEFE